MEGGREVQEGGGHGTYVHYHQFMLMYGRNQHNTVKAIILQLKLN